LNIETNEQIFLCSDNLSNNKKLKDKYPKLIITNLKIEHSSFNCSSLDGIFNSVLEFYVLSNAKKIYATTASGFALEASKIKSIPIIYPHLKKCKTIDCEYSQVLKNRYTYPIDYLCCRKCPNHTDICHKITFNNEELAAIP
jgi:hypothetical protein